MTALRTEPYARPNAIQVAFQQYGTLTSRNVQDAIEQLHDLIPEPSNSLNVQDYGAIGNGTSNDAPAIQDALDDAAASARKVVYVPHTTDGYALGATLLIPEGVALVGDNQWGGELSRLKPVPGFTDPLIRTQDYGVTRKLRIRLEGLFLDGSATTLTAVQLNCQESLLRNLTIKNCFTYGIHIGGVGSGATQQALNNHILDCYLAGILSTTEFFDGIFIDYNSADTTIAQCYIEASKDAGIRSRGYNDKFHNNHIYGVSGTGGGVGAGYYTETSADINFSSNYVELCDGPGVLIDGGGSDVATLNASVVNNLFRNIDTGNTESGVVVIRGADVSSVTVSGNAVRRDAALSHATAYFVYFDGISPTLQAVLGNSWQSGLITTAESNLTQLAALSVNALTATTVSPTTIELGHASDTTLSRSSAGNIAVEGNLVYRAGGTDVPVTDGGTGASDAATARTNLGLGTAANPQFNTIELGAASDTTLARSSAGNMSIEGNLVYRAGGTDVPVTDGGTGASDAATARTNLGAAASTVGQGKHTIWVPAGAMVPRTGGSAAAATLDSGSQQNAFPIFAFDPSSVEFCGFNIAMPKSWNEGSISFVPYWTAQSGTAGQGVVWTLEAKPLSDNDSLDAGAGPSISVTDSYQTANALHIGPESSGFTVTGVAEGDLIYFQMIRTATSGSDTLTSDAQLIGVKIFFTTNAATDD